MLGYIIFDLKIFSEKTGILLCSATGNVETEENLPNKPGLNKIC